MISWLTSTTLGKLIATFFISMAPIIELRGGRLTALPGLDYPVALAAAVLGNMVPVPFIIVYIRNVFAWLRKRSKWWDEKITRLEKKAHLKGPDGTQVQCDRALHPGGHSAAGDRRLDGRLGGSSAGHAAEEGHPGHLPRRMPSRRRL